MENIKRSNFQAHPFHLVSPSSWPIDSSTCLLTLTCAFVLAIHGFSHAFYFLIAALICLITCMALWFRDIISEGKLLYISNHFIESTNEQKG